MYQADFRRDTIREKTNMKAVNLAAFAFLCLFLGACRVEVIVPTSGTVTTTSGSMDCAAGTSCTMDVADIHFDETFVAEPADGFVFDGWKSGNRRICGNRTEPCHYSTANLEGNDDAIALLSDQDQVLYVEPFFKSTGFNLLGIGHSFFRPFIDGFPDHAARAGIPNHTQSRVFAGGANGAPQALWENPTRQAEIKAILDTGNVELFGMTYEPTYPTTEGYENWIDYALLQNPDTRFFLALPWADRPANTDAETYSSYWLTTHSTAWHAFIDTLRNLYPGVEIYCVPYGQSALELRNLFAADNLPEVSVLTGDTADAIFVDAKGHPGDILEHLGRLVWLNAIYGVDLSTYAWNPAGYSTDLGAIAQGIMDAHDPAYNAPYR